MFDEYLLNTLGVSPLSIEGYRKYIKPLKVEKGQFLLREGEVCRNTFFVEKGLLRLYSISKAGKEHIIQFAPENHLITDRSSLFFGESSDYFIDAIEDSEIISLSPDFHEYMRNNDPETNAKQILLLHNHARQLQKRVNLLLGANAEERYLDFIKVYPNVFRRVPQWMVASFLGITPESLSRVRKEITNKERKND